MLEYVKISFNRRFARVKRLTWSEKGPNPKKILQFLSLFSLVYDTVQNVTIWRHGPRRQHLIETVTPVPPEATAWSDAGAQERLREPSTLSFGVCQLF
eukprot:6190488-Pleurochrysis_carterae.AAC.1